MSSVIRTKIQQKKTQRLLKLLKVIIKYPGEFTTLILLTILLNTFHSLDINEIQELDDDLKANGWRVKSLL